MARKSYEDAKYFTVAFCGAFIVFSLLALGAALVPLGGVGSNDADTEARLPQEDVPVEDFYRPRSEDSISVLLTVHAQSGARSFVLAALDVEQGSVTAQYVPPGLMVRYDGTEMRLDALYERDGPLAAKKALAEALSMPVDRWMAFTEKRAVAAADLFGPVSYSAGDAAVRDSGPAPAQELRRMDGTGLRDLLFAQDADSTEIEQAVQAFLHAALLCAPTPEADDLFRAAVNLADTDISFFDYDSRREALRFLAGLAR